MNLVGQPQVFGWRKPRWRGAPWQYLQIFEGPAAALLEPAVLEDGGAHRLGGGAATRRLAPIASVDADAAEQFGHLVDDADDGLGDAVRVGVHPVLGADVHDVLRRRRQRLGLEAGAEPVDGVETDEAPTHGALAQLVAVADVEHVAQQQQRQPPVGGVDGGGAVAAGAALVRTRARARLVAARAAALARAFLRRSAPRVPLRGGRHRHRLRRRLLQGRPRLARQRIADPVYHIEKFHFSRCSKTCVTLFGLGRFLIKIFIQ